MHQKADLRGVGADRPDAGLSQVRPSSGPGTAAHAPHAEAPGKGGAPVARRAWLELDRLAPARDMITLLGYGFIVWGVSRINVPAAWIVAGAGLLLAAWGMAEK